MPDRIRHIFCHDGLTVLDNYVYVLGTGSSLLNLSKREREYLHQHPRTLAINRYYLYYEKLGILPKMLFVADFNYFADLIVRAAIERLNAKDHEIPFYVNQAYIDFYTTPWYTYPLFKRRARHMLRRRYRYTPPADLPEYYRLRGFSVANECT